MREQDFIVGEKGLIRADTVTYVDTEHLVDEGYVDVLHEGEKSRVSGFFALEAVMLLKPGALEGKRFRWPKRVWLFHNIVAHPVMQFMTLAADVTKPLAPDLSRRLYRAAIHLHDATVPAPTGFRTETAPQAKPG